MSWLLLGVIGLILIGIGARYRRKSLLLRENEQRRKLGLPSLTEGEFMVDPVEKSADYRGKINQHM